MKQLFIYLAIGIMVSLTSCWGNKNDKDNGATDKVGVEVGQTAPEIKLQSPAGETIALSSFRGKVVLIDFWASWCPPCRQENPNIVAAYRQYKDAQFDCGDGFTIFSISLDKDAEAWKRGITADSLDWPAHVSELNSWYSEAVKTYQVEAIPSNFLIDSNGVIIAHNLRGEALHSKLQELLK